MSDFELLDAEFVFLSCSSFFSLCSLSSFCMALADLSTVMMSRATGSGVLSVFCSMGVRVLLDSPSPDGVLNPIGEVFSVPLVIFCAVVFFTALSTLGVQIGFPGSLGTLP